MPKPRIGVVSFWKNYDRKLYLRAAQLADELGYDSFWVPEAWGYETFPLLTEMAVHTKRIKLGTGISGQRVIEGFHGRPFDKPLTQTRDVIRVVRTLLAGQKLSEAGAEN